MPNHLFNLFSGNQVPQQNQANRMPTVEEFLANPAQYKDLFEKFKMELPSNPEAMVKQMIQSGQVPQNKVNMVMNMASMLRRFIH